MEWWVIEGVPKPVYVYKGRDRGRVLAITALISLVALLIVQSLGELLHGPAFIIIILCIIAQFIASLGSSLQRTVTSSDIAYAKQLLRVLDGRVRVWSIPSPYIVVAAQLENTAYLYLYLYKGQLYMIYGRPIVYGRIVKPSKKVKVLKIEDYMGLVETISVSRREYRVKRLDVIAPNPGSPMIWYQMRIRGYLFKTTDIEPSIIDKLVSR